MNPANRPALSLDAATLSRLTDFIAEGGTLKAFAAEMGIARETLSRWVSSDPERRAALCDAADDRAASLVREALAPSWCYVTTTNQTMKPENAWG